MPTRSAALVLSAAVLALSLSVEWQSPLSAEGDVRPTHPALTASYRAGMPAIEVPELPGIASEWLRQPSISPDGKTVCFCYDGDLWLVPAEGGTARRITVTEDNEYGPLFSPDGKWLAFRSKRNGSYDIYVMAAEGGEARRLTWSDADDLPSCWLPDSSGIIFESSRRRNAYDLWMVRLSGGEPWPITDGGYRESENTASISPDGKFITYVVRGGSGGYRRRGYAGSSNNRIWIADFDGVATSNHRPLAVSNAHQTWPVWTSARSLVYVDFSSAEGASRYSRFTAVDLDESGKITESGHLFPDVSDVREPAFAANKLVFTTGAYGGWKCHIADTEKATVQELQVSLNSDRRTSRDTMQRATTASEAVPSPDGKKIAFVASGDVYVMAADSGAIPRRVTETVGRERQVAWNHDSNALAYISDRAGEPQIYIANLEDQTERQFSDHVGGASFPVFVNKGTELLYLIDEVQMVRRKLESESFEHLLWGYFHGAERSDNRPYDLAPDESALTFTLPNALLDDQVVVFNLATKELKVASARFGSCMHARFSEDGKRIVYAGSEAGSIDIFSLDLQERPEEFPEDKLDELFKKPEPKDKGKGDEKSPAPAEGASAAKPESAANTATAEAPAPAPAPAAVPERPRSLTLRRDTPALFADLEVRTTRLTTDSGNEMVPVATKDGKTVFYIGSTVGSNIWKIDLNESGAVTGTRQVTNTRTGKSDLRLSADGKYLWFLDSGKPARMALNATAPTTYSFSVTQRWNRRALREQAFDECIWVLRNYFYDPDMHGVPLDTIAAHYRAALESVSTGDEWGSLMNDLLGELNSSHQGFTAVDTRSDSYSESIGHLGLDFDPQALSEGRYVISRILRGGPSDREALALANGDQVLALNGKALDGATSLAQLLVDCVGIRTTLNIRRVDGREEVVKVRPVSRGALSGPEYEMWVAEQREIVSTLSGGRLGYVHIQSMNTASVEHFKHHLGNDMADKDGVVIDVRYNGGGSTAVDLLEILVKSPWLVRTRRGLEAEAITENVNRSIAWEKPACLLINYASFSNAEIMAEGFRALNIGPIIGTPTGGGVIGTSSHSLVDGSRMRLPLSGAYAVNGENLENNGRAPDILVENHPDQVSQGVDAQASEAVGALMKQIK